MSTLIAFIGPGIMAVSTEFGELAARREHAATAVVAMLD